MSMPFYVSPEQQMLDRAEFARKGIARGRAVVVLSTDAGILLVAENRSTTLHKVSEIYDRIGFAAVGRYHEFEMLRIAGIRHADLRGFSYDRSDVTARSVAGAYSQILGSAFASAVDKPFEVELVLAELGEHRDHDVLYRIGHDGVIHDERDHCVIGGDAERIAQALTEGEAVTGLDDGLRLAAHALGELGPDALEVAVLERESARRRRFRRVALDQVREWLS